MSIQSDRIRSLTQGRFPSLVKSNVGGLKDCLQHVYRYTNTHGRLLQEEPLQSLQRWLQPCTYTLRKVYLRDKRLRPCWY